MSSLDGSSLLEISATSRSLALPSRRNVPFTPDASFLMSIGSTLAALDQLQTG